MTWQMSAHEEAPLSVLASALMTMCSSGKTVRGNLELRFRHLQQHFELGSEFSRKFAQAHWSVKAHFFLQACGAFPLLQASADAPVVQAKVR